MSRRWTHQFHSPERRARLMDNSRCLFPLWLTLLATFLSPSLWHLHLSPWVFSVAPEPSFLSPFCFFLFKSNFIIQTTLFPFLDSHRPPPSQIKQMDTSPANVAPRAYPLLTAAHKSCRSQTSFTALREKNNASKEIKRVRKQMCVSINIFLLSLVFSWSNFCWINKGSKLDTVPLSLPGISGRRRSEGMTTEGREWFDKVNLFFCVHLYLRGFPASEMK